MQPPDPPGSILEHVPKRRRATLEALLAPAATPQDIVARISADVRAVLAQDEVRKKLVDLGAVPMGTAPAAFAKLIDDDRRRYTQIIRERRITAE